MRGVGGYDRWARLKNRREMGELRQEMGWKQGTSEEKWRWKLDRKMDKNGENGGKKWGQNWGMTEGYGRDGYGRWKRLKNRIEKWTKNRTELKKIIE